MRTTLALLLIFAAALSAHAQEPKGKFQFEGVTSCAGCHDKPNAIYERTGATKFVQLTESATWLTLDKHSQAVELIDPAKNPLAKQMCEQLKIADIHEAKQCLSCHANWQYDKVEQQWAERPKFHEFGVSCESCHGAASEWKGPHEKPEWRKLPPDEKLKKGFIEIRNPLARAKQCLACHVGDPEQQKVVTHEMYAAGHPPLPGVELETFMQELPPHWRHVSQKLADNKAKFGEDKSEFEHFKEFLAANPSATAGGDFHKSRSALLSSLVAMEASLTLVGWQFDDQKKLPDFAVFDCYACHHDLKSPAWRQQRKDVKRPGRPRPAVWPTTLVDAALAFADVDPAAWHAALDEYRDAFDAQPFGNAEREAAARSKLQAELKKIIVAVEASPSDKAAAERAFVRLCSPTDATLDYDAARQTAWAVRVLAIDLKRKLPDDFGASLHLTLPAGQQKQIAKDLPARMKAMAEYDPERFKAELRAIAPQ
jgi:hypothetical protein